MQVIILLSNLYTTLAHNMLQLLNKIRYTNTGLLDYQMTGLLDYQITRSLDYWITNDNTNTKYYNISA